MYSGLLYKKRIPKAQIGFTFGNVFDAIPKNKTQSDFKALATGQGNINLNTGTTGGQNQKALDTQELATAKAETKQGIANNGGSVSTLGGGKTMQDVLKTADLNMTADLKTQTDKAVAASAASLNGAKATAKLSENANSFGKGGVKPMSGIGGSAVSMGAGLAEVGAGLLTKDAGIDYEDLDKEVNQGKIAAGGAVSGAAKGAQMGMAFGPWGAAIGGVLGGVAGFFGGKKKAKEEEEQRHKLVVNRDIGIMDKHQSENAEESNRLAAEVSGKYSKTGRSIVAKNGTKFMIYYGNYTLPNTKGPVTKISRTLPVFKKGGKITNENNIIPNGVSHEEKNSMGTKGMPVVKCTTNSCSKIYEIESDELILTKKVTKQIENLAKANKLNELGEFFSSQILDNTHSYTEKFVL
jgi:hypothetical protein